jgi:hypothetical protein
MTFVFYRYILSILSKIILFLHQTLIKTPIGVYIQSFPDKDFRLEIKNTILSIGMPKELSVNNTLSIAKFLEEI